MFQFFLLTKPLFGNELNLELRAYNCGFFTKGVKINWVNKLRELTQAKRRNLSI